MYVNVIAGENANTIIITLSTSPANGMSFDAGGLVIVPCLRGVCLLTWQDIKTGYVNNNSFLCAHVPPSNHWGHPCNNEILFTN